MKHFHGAWPQKCIIWSPLGRSWLVEMVNLNDSLFFGKGWKAFVEDHSLEEGDLLLFKYDGNLVFDVKVFGKNRCEKSMAPRKDDHEQVGKAKSYCNTKFPNEKEIDYERLVEALLDGSQTPNKKIKTKEGNPSNEARNLKREVELEYADDSSSEGDAASNEKKRERMSPSMFSSRVFALSCQGSQKGGSPSTDEAGRRDIPCNSENLSFRVTMKPSHVGLCRGGGASLSVPSKFMATNFSIKDEDGFITVETDGSHRSWSVKYCTTSRKLSLGWLDFVRDNHVEMNDECEFEVDKEKVNTLKVSIHKK
ncbi:B3 domain-containing protein Os03g0620400-like isoform X2 [Tripterygium wilfordii]|nr:B3 domain-containing protein Os03g0620400-like isoform X2 [Tripterygium wilfordii]XP_038714675.1 B3 domain-containing protein Os03g0620400-like isoform X2 [Tripterygium wilfordii]XP_038714676.1 B3 domain-containing protein Os03g0620400-like isoform X2 [Tripterygium wilfordii]